jgi:Uma2 family endonuclease
MSLRTILTYEDYAALPADGRRYELHEGEVYVTPAPSPQHQEIVRNLLVILHAHVRRSGTGKVFPAPIDCILSEATIVQPDLVYVDAASVSLVSERGIEGPPTLAVEVLSPTSRAMDRGAKAQLYARYRVSYYWIVDPRLRTIDGYVLEGEHYQPSGSVHVESSAALPPFADLALAPDAIWP